MRLLPGPHPKSSKIRLKTSSRSYGPLVVFPGALSQLQYSGGEPSQSVFRVLATCEMYALSASCSVPRRTLPATDPVAWNATNAEMFHLSSLNVRRKIEHQCFKAWSASFSFQSTHGPFNHIFFSFTNRIRIEIKYDTWIWMINTYRQERAGKTSYSHSSGSGKECWVGGEATASRFYLQLIGLVVTRRLLADDETNKGCLLYSLP